MSHSYEITRTNVVRNPRLAGQVARYHTWPVLRGQSVGEHSWQVLRIYYQIWGRPSTAVVQYVLWHDAGELVSGDLPFPVKAENPEIKRRIDRVEKAAVAAMGGALPTLTPLERQRVKLADLIDMWELGLVEQVMGNQFAAPIVLSTSAAVREMLGAVPASAVLAYMRRFEELCGARN